MAGVTDQIDGPTGLFLLEKRAHDERRFTLDVSGKLLEGDEIDGDPTVTTSAEGRITGAAALTISDINADGTRIAFTCSGGSAGEVYTLTVQYASDTETALESLVAVGVL